MSQSVCDKKIPTSPSSEALQKRLVKKVIAIKMKVFQTVEDNFTLMGISAYQSQQKYPFNAKNLLVLFILCSTFFSDAMYLIREANDFKEYTISVFSISTMAVSILIFVIALAEMRNIYFYRNLIEETINKSKRKFSRKKIIKI